MDGVDSHQGAPFVKPKKAKVKGSPGDDLIKIFHRSASLENIFMYTYTLFYIYIYIHMWPYVCTRIQPHSTAFDLFNYFAWVQWNRTMKSLEGHKKQDQEQVRKARARLCQCRPCRVLMVLYLFCYFAIQKFRVVNACHWCFSDWMSLEFGFSAQRKATERRFSREQLRQKLRSP